MLKVGRKVRIRKDLESGAHYPFANGERLMYFNSEMSVFKGKVVTIDGCTGENSIYTIKEDDGEWAWVESMFDIDNSLTVEIIRKRGK